MAILRAISGDNFWSTPEKWEVYNAQTNTWSAYNNSPQNGDYCYLNGYTLKISSTSGINIGNGTIDNVGNADIGVSSGGAIDISAFATRNVTANFVIGDQQMYRFASNSGQIWTFIGDITIVGTASFGGGAIYGNNSINILGNVTFKNAPLFNLNTVISSLTITGNVTSEGGILYNVATPVTINGNVTDLMLNSTTTINGSYTLAQYNSDSNITATINGDLNLFNGHYLSCATLNFYGDSIKYSGWATDSIGNLKVKDLNIGNLTNFTWHDVSVVRTAPFFIVTDYDLNNTQQYPTPANVKKDIPYAFNQLVGTYLPDYPPETVVLKDYVYDTITAEENDIATYNLTRYIYADYGTLHWFELKTTTTDIVTDPTLQSIDIDGDTVAADTDYVVEYNDACYQWDGSAWGSITTNNIGTVKTDIVTNPTETTLCAKKGTLDVPSTQAIVTAINQSTIATNVNTLLQRLSDGLTQRLGQSVTIPILQQILDAHLN